MSAATRASALLALCLGGCGAAETPKPLPTRVATGQTAAPVDVFGTQPDVAPPVSDDPMVRIESVDASAPLSASWPSPPQTPTNPCGGGPTLRRLANDPAPSAPVMTSFDRDAAAGALARVNVTSCATPGGPLGSGHIKVTFAPGGYVAAAEVDSPPFAGMSVARCIADKFREARVPAFGAGCVTIGKSFSLLR